MTIKYQSDFKQWVVHNQTTGEFATTINGRCSKEYPDAKKFQTFGAASKWSQNYGPDFQVTDADEN